MFLLLGGCLQPGAALDHHLTGAAGSDLAKGLQQGFENFRLQRAVR